MPNGGWKWCGRSWRWAGSASAASTKPTLHGTAPTLPARIPSTPWGRNSVRCVNVPDRCDSSSRSFVVRPAATISHGWSHPRPVRHDGYCTVTVTVVWMFPSALSRTVSRSVYMPGSKPEVVQLPSVPLRTGLPIRSIVVQLLGACPLPYSSVASMYDGEDAVPLTVTRPLTADPSVGEVIVAVAVDSFEPPPLLPLPLLAAVTFTIVT